MWAAFSAALLPAQSLRVYSEFTRVDPFGQIVPADRSPQGLAPREILSPILVRNGHSSFHVVVSVPQGEEFSLFVEQNPAGALQLNLYKEKYQQRGEVWIPDLLKPVATSYTGHIPDPASQLEHQTHMSFLLDIRVPAKAPVRRYRVEAQLLVRGRYIIYPMEVRVVSPLPVEAGPAIGTLPDIGAGSDAAAAAVLEAQLCEADPEPPGAATGAPLTLRRIIRRNARQDMAMARELTKQRGRDVVAALLGLEQGREAWCGKPRLPVRERGAEWYLRVRDHLYRLRREGLAEAPIEAAPELKVPVLE